MTRAAGPPAAPARCHRTRFSLLKTGLYVCAYCRFCLAAPPSGFVISIKFLGSVGVSADSASAVYSRRTGLRTLGQSVYSLTYVRTQDFSTLAHLTAIVCKLLNWAVFSDPSAPALWPTTFFEPMREVYMPRRGSCASSINVFSSGRRVSLGQGLPETLLGAPCPRAPHI